MDVTEQDVSEFVELIEDLEDKPLRVVLANERAAADWLVVHVIAPSPKPAKLEHHLTVAT